MLVLFLCMFDLILMFVHILSGFGTCVCVCETYRKASKMFNINALPVRHRSAVGTCIGERASAILQFVPKLTPAAGRAFGILHFAPVSRRPWEAAARTSRAPQAQLCFWTRVFRMSRLLILSDFDAMIFYAFFVIW